MGKQGRPAISMWIYNPICAGHCQHWGRQGPRVWAGTSLFTSAKWGKKGIALWPIPQQGISAISVVFPLCRCTILDQSTGFQWSCHLPSNLFQTVTDRAWALPPLFLPPPPHTFILDESYFNTFLSQGTVLSGGKHWAVYMHLIKNVWNVHKSSQVRKRKGPLHQDVKAIKELVSCKSSGGRNG